ncbi:hypothetical protein BDY19DRAFT_1058850 [Irpex rosettiformis]|uniref:Uncharacterized protein n=1 Tax=Irpex rosettiformis TaxID=378272 RepID=A0ACB8TXI6_9APHY|nr:hypothetical protein BDY19DRAFT_1058850 [Irpex rosettiformis]
MSFELGSALNAASLLPEILDQIFCEVEYAYTGYSYRKMRDDHLKVNNTRDPLNDNTMLDGDGSLAYPPKITKTLVAPLTRVCKQWKPIAERRLYHYIAISSSQYHERVPRLLRTFKEHPRLADLVRKLSMAEEEVYVVVPQTQSLAAGILLACTQLSHLTLVGSVTQLLAEPGTLWEYLSRVTSLRSLVLVQSVCWSAFDDTSEYGLCSVDALLQKMSQWRNIEHVSVLTSASLSPAEPTSALPTSLSQLPHLRTFSFLQPITSSSSLRLLKTAAPRLETLRISLEVTTDWDQLRDALIAWAPSLHTLHLDHSSQLACWPGVEDVLIQLSNLRFLHTTTSLIPPETLHCLDVLETLEYNIESLSHVDALIDVVSQLSKLRSLRMIRFPVSLQEELALKMDTLDSACRDRNITFSDSIRPLPNDSNGSEEGSDDDDDDALGYGYNLSYGPYNSIAMDEWLDTYFFGAPYCGTGDD